VCECVGLMMIRMMENNKKKERERARKCESIGK
jgi:hypothetical protein